MQSVLFGLFTTLTADSFAAVTGVHRHLVKLNGGSQLFVFKAVVTCIISFSSDLVSSITKKHFYLPVHSAF